MSYLEIGLCVIILMLLFCPVKYDPAFYNMRKQAKKQIDRYTRQAKIDQKNADHPGCQLGLMECRSTSCGCDEGRPHPAFVRERAKYLMEKGIPDDDS